MNNLKKFLVFTLIAFMIIPGICDVNVLALEEQKEASIKDQDTISDEDQKLIDEFTEGVFALKEKDIFVDLVELLHEISDPAGFSDTYSKALGKLTSSQKSRLENYQLTADAVKGFSQFMKDNEFSVEALRNYLKEDSEHIDDNKEAFAEQIAERVNEFKTALEIAGVVDAKQEALKSGFAQMNKIFGILDDFQALDTLGLKPAVFESKKIGGDFTLNRKKGEALINLANRHLEDDIEDKDSVLNGFQEFVDYYNGLESEDKNLVYNYLNDLKLVKRESSSEPSTGGGGGGGDSEPSDEEEQIPSDNVQDELDSKVKVELKPVITSSGTLKATVSTSNLKDAWKKTQEVLKGIKDKTEDTNKQIKNKIVLEVPKTDDVEKVNIALPVKDIQNLEKDGLDVLQINSQVGSVEFDTSSIIDKGQSAKEITFSIEAVSDVTSKEVPKGSIVVDFNLSVDGDKVTKFNSPIRLSIPYEPKKGDNKDEITVYLLQDDNTSVPVGGVYNKTTGKVEFTTNHFSKYYAKKSRVSFNDVDKDYWAKDYIEVLAGKGIITGKEKGLFDPTASITRAEFVALINRMLNLVETDKIVPFTDIDKSEWYAEEITPAYQTGLINGRSSTTFAPNAPITRQEVALVIENTLKYLGYNTEKSSKLIKNKFADYDDIDSWAIKAVSTVYREEIISGKPNNMFDPKGNASRAEVAKMMYILFKK